jgi:reactive intermediate/imine deaminase
MRTPICAALALLTMTGAVLATDRPDPATAQYLGSDLTDGPKLPFSEAVRVGNLLFLSGMVAVKPGTTQIVAGGIEAETRQALENIRAVLERHGSSLDRVVKCTVMLADIGEWSRMNAVYVTFFPQHFPARSALGVSGLALGARVEIECLATVGSAT